MEKKKRALPTIKAQKDILLEFMSLHPELRSGRFTPTFTFKKAKELWMEVSLSLNAIPNGSNKDWRQWRKTWQDYKKNVKARAAQHNLNVVQTGGGPAPSSPDPEDVQILDLLSETEIYGIPTIKETPANFTCDDSETPLTMSTSYNQDEKENLTFEAEEFTIAESVEVANETTINHEHNYTFLHPAPTSSKMKRTPQKFNKTRRLENSLKVSQSLLKSVEKKSDYGELLLQKNRIC